MKEPKAIKVEKFVNEYIDKINTTSRTLEDLYNFIMTQNEKQVAYMYFNDSGTYRKCTYGEYKDKVFVTASKLSKAFQGIPHGAVIGLKLKNSPYWGIFFWAILMTGHTPLLIDAKLPIENTNNLLKQSSAKGLVANDEADFCVPKFRINEINNLNRDYEFTTDFANHIIFCSSGTTGDAKMMVYRGQNLVNQICEAKAFIGETRTLIYPGKLRVFAMLPLHHIFGFVAVFLWYHFFGKTIVYPNSIATSDLMTAIKVAKVTHLFSVPLFWDSIAQNVRRTVAKESEKTQELFERMIAYNCNKISKREAKLASSGAFQNAFKKKILGKDLMFAISGGGFLSPKTLSLINGLGYHLYNGFGMTEVGVTSVELSPKVEYRLKGSVGKALYGVEYRIGDGTLPPCTPGELFIKTKAVHSREIIGGVTKRVALEQEFYPTGDIGSLDEKGYLYVNGRIKDTIILSNGENVYPDEIEYYFKDVPYLHNAVCLGAKLPGDTEEKIILVCEVDNSVDKDGLKQVLDNIDSVNASLASEKRVHKVLIDTHPLPVSGSMKVKRFEIKKAIESGKADYIGLENEKQETVVSFDKYDQQLVKSTLERVTKVFSKVLLLPEFKIAPEAIWTVDLGGDSMSYIEMVQALEEEFKIIIPQEKYGLLKNVNDFTGEILETISKNTAK